MKVKVVELRERPARLQFEIPPADIGLGDIDDVEFPSLVKGDVKLSQIGHEILMRGSCATQATMACVACDRPLQVTLDCPDINIIYLPRPHETDQKGEAVEVTVDERDTAFYDGEIIDISDTIRELLLVELPSYPRCEGTCRPLEGPDAKTGDTAADETVLPEWKRKLKDIKLNNQTE